VLVAVGRRAFSEGLGARAVGVAMDEKGRITVDAHYATSVPGIYAIGDVITGPMLAHKASEEGMAVAERIAGQASHVNYSAIPNIVYTWPELASVGITEEQAQTQDIPFRVGTFPFLGNGRARCMNETEGLVKILADTRTDRVLGIHILGPRASDIIAEAVIAMEFGASAEDIARSVHAHPTLRKPSKRRLSPCTSGRCTFEAAGGVPRISLRRAGAWSAARLRLLTVRLVASRPGFSSGGPGCLARCPAAWRPQPGCLPFAPVPVRCVAVSLHGSFREGNGLRAGQGQIREMLGANHIGGTQQHARSTRLCNSRIFRASCTAAVPPSPPG